MPENTLIYNYIPNKVKINILLKQNALNKPLNSSNSILNKRHYTNKISIFYYLIKH